MSNKKVNIHFTAFSVQIFFTGKELIMEIWYFFVLVLLKSVFLWCDAMPLAATRPMTQCHVAEELNLQLTVDLYMVYVITTNLTLQFQCQFVVIINIVLGLYIHWIDWCRPVVRRYLIWILAVSSAVLSIFVVFISSTRQIMPQLGHDHVFTNRLHFTVNESL
jgi:hypothetical protein